MRASGELDFTDVCLCPLLLLSCSLRAVNMPMSEIIEKEG